MASVDDDEIREHNSLRVSKPIGLVLLQTSIFVVEYSLDYFIEYLITR